MRIRTLHTTALVAMLATGAQAIVLGGSNLGFRGYPEADCRKPEPPMRPFSPASRWDIERYNMEVDRYNRELEIFISCTREYLEHAQNDIKRIRERMEEALERAKR